MAELGVLWAARGPAARMAFVAALVLLVGLIALASVWLVHDPYEVLFTELEPRDGAGVVTELDRMKVAYRVAEGGARIEVPASEVHGVRLKLMGQGVPISGGVGFEIFNESDFGMTEFAQKVNFQRALQGELTRTIMALEEVKFARVHLVLPESGLFKRKDSWPSASVTVFLKNEKRLGAGQIAGIQRLVASSVSALEPSMVTVVDDTGIILSSTVPRTGGIAAISERLQKKREVESYLSAKLTRILDGAFGSGEVVVSVDATLNFNQIKTTQESVIPNDSGNLVRKRESKFGAAEGKRRTAGNLVTEVEYRVGREIAQIVEMPGAITRLNVGVVIPAGMPAARRAEVRDLVATSAGLDFARGDAIAVHPRHPGPSRRSDAGKAQLPMVDSRPAAPEAAVRLRFAQRLSQPRVPTVAPAVPVTPMAPPSGKAWTRDGMLMAEDAGEGLGPKTDLLGGLRQEFERFTGDWRWFAIGGLGVVILLTVVVLAVFAFRRPAGTALTVEEREALLREIRGWLDTSEPESAR